MCHIMKQQTVKLSNLIDILSWFVHSSAKQHCFSVKNIIYVHVNSNITQISKCVRAFAGLRPRSPTNLYMQS